MKLDTIPFCYTRTTSFPQFTKLRYHLQETISLNLSGKYHSDKKRILDLEFQQSEKMQKFPGIFLQINEQKIISVKNLMQKSFFKYIRFFC